MKLTRFFLVSILLGLLLQSASDLDRSLAFAAPPAIKLSADTGDVDSIVKITISGFSPRAGVTVRFDRILLAEKSTNGRGRLVLSIQIPESTSGEHRVQADTVNESAATQFNVLPTLSLSLTTVRQGESLKTILKGFGSNERVVLWLTTKTERKRITTVRTNGSGSTSKSIEVPLSTVNGSARLEAQGDNGNSASAKVKIKGASPTPLTTATIQPTGTMPSSALTMTTTPTSTATRTAIVQPTSTASPSRTPASTPRATSTATPTRTQTSTPQPTSTTPGEVSIWVDPENGNDSNSGSSRSNAVLTIAEAWRRIPARLALTTPYRIRLVAGQYPADGLPNYMEQRYGTSANPIAIEANDGSGTAVISGSWNIFDVRYLALSGVSLINAGDVVHCELCDHFSILNSSLNGQGAAHETLKINQSQHIVIEGSVLSGSYENAIDFVAVQHGRITNNRIHDAEDWCMYLKGGSADFWIEGNEIFNCGTGGFTAGQGTGFQFMVSPWLTYEAIDITFIRNEIHDTDGAGMGVNGGKNILLAENHLVRVGARSHLLEIGFGGRSCDGQPGDEGRERCAQYLAEGGWGTTAVDDGNNYIRIPNKNVTIRDNVIENPAGYRSQWQHFSIAGPYSSSSQSGSNAPDPAYADDGLVITGNVIVNGDQSMPLGLGEDSGCQPANTTCNETQLYRDNDINGR